ncbi:MAG: hypothetical protein M4579_002611 [Chaenotheca gracillima]|nr:MAG: hypothetical protein M4579_002611 [Chaenotheca gracillima]
MYSTPHPVTTTAPTTMNGMGSDLVDGSGTINPAALNPAGECPRSVLVALVDDASCRGLSQNRAHTSHACRSVVSSCPSRRVREANNARAAVMSLVLSNHPTVLPPDSSPRGIKRSRSQDSYGGDVPLTGEGGDENGESTRMSEPGRMRLATEELTRLLDDTKPRKRGRPPKTKSSTNPGQSPNAPIPQQTPTKLPSMVRTPQLQNQTLSSGSNASPPTQVSPAKSTPTKSVIKALPTVRDHTTDQVSPEGDEYVPREHDEAGEKKVSPTGHPLDGREYRCRTFYVPNRGEKVFMLATECARVLSYRDSYLLFNKNRSLYKIIASQAEKDDLIQQEILPYSYRSRQIAIVTAKSMFRQFGSRVIVNGRRVRDDYWESKAIKQGFTEEDAAGEKRPGAAAKARDAAAAEAANAAIGVAGHHPDIVYNGPASLESHLQPQSVQPGMGGPAVASLAPLPMIHAPADDARIRDYGNVPRPRQEITGPPYQDRLLGSSNAEIMNQAQHSAEFNKALGQQRTVRGKYMEGQWHKPRDVPTAAAHLPSATQGEQGQHSHQSLSSPQISSSGLYSGDSQLATAPQARQPQALNPQTYSQQPLQQQTSVSQSPLRNTSQASVRPDQLQHRSPSLNLNAAGSNQGGAGPYGYPQSNQMWPPPQPHQSPLSQTHHAIPHYGSPHPTHQQSPHPQQSPHQASHQLHQPGPQMPSTQMQYQNMQGMGPGGYPPNANRGIYQMSPGQQQYMHQSTAGSQQGMQGWAPPPQGQQGPQGWGWGSSG